MMANVRNPPSRDLGFTLIEMLVSMGIIVILLLVLVSITDFTRRTWVYTTGKVEQFRDAREGFESLTRRISQATLNTYWDYLDKNGNAYTATAVTGTGSAVTSGTFVPATYGRVSELRFISGPATSGTALLNGIKDRNNIGPIQAPTHAIFFQAPLGYVQDTVDYAGLENLLNTWGFYVELVNDSSIRPPFLNSIPSFPTHTRFRLMEMMEPSESLSVYSNPTAPNWFSIPMGTTSQRRVVADNVIALIILPKLSPEDEQAGNPPYTDASLAPNYTYDSTMVGAGSADPMLNSHNQLPPLVQVVLVAIDERSAIRLGNTGSQALFAKLNSLFTNAANLNADLLQNPTLAPASDPSIEAYLIQNRINYRIFSTNVSIKAAKWSRSQTN